MATEATATTIIYRKKQHDVELNGYAGPIPSDDLRDRDPEHIWDAGVYACRGYDLGGGWTLYIDTNQGMVMYVQVSKDPIEEIVRDWWCNETDGSNMLAEWLSQGGLDGLATLTEATEEHEGECLVWRAYHYYPGTYNTPQDGFDRDESDELRTFKTFAEAKKYVDAYDEESGYNGIKECMVMSHGQAGPDTLTIVDADL